MQGTQSRHWSAALGVETSLKQNQRASDSPTLNLCAADEAFFLLNIIFVKHTKFA